MHYFPFFLRAKLEKPMAKLLVITREREVRREEPTKRHFPPGQLNFQLLLHPLGCGLSFGR